MIEIRGCRPMRIAGGAAALGGAMLFAWSIRRAGAAEVLEGVRRIGAGMIIVVCLGGLRGLLRTVAWRLCLDPEHQRPLASLFSAYLGGDAIGNVTPFGFLISEPSKIVLVRRRIDVPASVAALTVENLVYGATVVLMLVAGTGAFLLSFAVPPPIRIASIATLVTALMLAAAAAWILVARRRVVSGAVEWLIARGIAAEFLQERLPSIRQAGDRIFDFATRRRSAVLPLVALEVLYHLTAIAEIWFALALITGTPPPVLTAFVLEYVNRTITVVFQFVPMWLGVDEAGTSLATGVLHLGSAPGVSLALVRKARVLVWTAAGIALLIHRSAKELGIQN